MWACMWPLCEALSSVRVQGGMDLVSWMVVDGGGVVDGKRLDGSVS